jgi:hypothetical protein
MLSCASNSAKNNGRAAANDDIKAMFEAHEYVPEYNYYYTDDYRTKSPYAIVGIKKDYELVKDSSGLYWTNWQQFEPRREKLKELVEAVNAATTYYSSTIGYIIYAPGGEDQKGIMYSKQVEPDIPEIRFKDRNLIVVKPRKYLLSSGAP